MALAKENSRFKTSYKETGGTTLESRIIDT